MAGKQGSSNGKGRKKGDWIVIATGRARNVRDIVNGHGVSNVPKVGAVGSAAYRRLHTPRER